ncbi:MAG: outer membrane beta-barrel protein [Paludibacteraceae bacterium]
MKRLWSALILVLMVGSVCAQQQSLGVEIGFTQPVLRENPATEKKKLPNVTTLNGMKVGLVYDATLIKGFGFRLGVNYTLGGNQSKWISSNPMALAEKTREKNMMHTIEIPIDWQYKFTIAKETYLILYTGPALQYTFAFDKTTQTKNELLGTESSTKVNHYSVDRDEDGRQDYSPFNITWGVGAGFQYKNYYLRGGYDFGIINHYKDRFYNSSIESQEYKMNGRFDQWSIKLGIYFLNF